MFAFIFNHTDSQAERGDRYNAVDTSNVQLLALYCVSDCLIGYYHEQEVKSGGK